MFLALNELTHKVRRSLPWGGPAERCQGLKDKKMRAAASCLCPWRSPLKGARDAVVPCKLKVWYLPEAVLQCKEK